MSEEVYASSIAGDDKDKNLAVPLVARNTSTAVPPSVEPRTSELEVTEDTECGIGFIRGRLLQRLANKNVYVFLYGLSGLILSACLSYNNSTITTIEKRFKIPSKTIGYIAVGNDITQLCVSLFLGYYAGKGHRPRWVAFSIYTTVLYCMLTVLPHVIYGPGEDALNLTREYGEKYSNLSNTSAPIDKDTLKKLCAPNAEGLDCDQSTGDLAAPIILFLALLVSGVGGSLHYTIGVSYMDDNIRKTNAPAQITIIILIRMLGPTLGYALGSLCLSFYIAPTLTPTIDQQDPRWLGAWWIGWTLLGSILFIVGSIVGLFPKQLPKTAARKALRAQAQNQNLNEACKEPEAPVTPASFSDMMQTFKRLLTNPILLCNTAASVFYIFGYEPYWVFMAKYIEIQYRKSAAVANLTTGTVGLMFSASGTILAGFVITKYKPSARQMSLWNVFVGLTSAVCIGSYTFLGCPANNNLAKLTSKGEMQTVFNCNMQCDCEYVPYSPICALDGKSTFISACHAGCSNFTSDAKGAKTYTNCSCIPPEGADPDVVANWTVSSPGWTEGGWAKTGSCPVECNNSFFAFLAVVCLLKFSGATGRATNFLVAVRCVAEKDKPVAMALESTILSLFAFMPSLIVYGYLMDATCLVWGKTCSGTGNCWLYDNESLRYMLNLTAAALLMIGVMFDLGVWHNAKNLKIFDEEEQSPKNSTKIKKKVKVKD